VLCKNVPYHTRSDVGSLALPVTSTKFEMWISVCNNVQPSVGHRACLMSTVRRLFECVPHFLDIAVSTAWIRPGLQAISQLNYVFYVCKVCLPLLSFVPMSILVPFVILLRRVIFPVSQRPFWPLCIVQNLKPWLLPSFFAPFITTAIHPCLTSSSKICKSLAPTSNAVLLLNSLFSAAVSRISNVFQISASYIFALLCCTKLLYASCQNGTGRLAIACRSLSALRMLISERTNNWPSSNRQAVVLYSQWWV